MTQEKDYRHALEQIAFSDFSADIARQKARLALSPMIYQPNLLLASVTFPRCIRCGSVVNLATAYVDADSLPHYDYYCVGCMTDIEDRI